MMIEQIINDIYEAYYNQVRKNKDGTRYKVIISPALFNRVCDYDVDLIQINEYDNYFIMGIPLAKDFTMNGLEWELCIVKNSKNYKCASNHEQFKEWLEELKHITNPRPYKFEDLKKGMWVWDDRLKACFLIKAIRPKTNWNIVIYANYLTDTFEELEFEENRFYPITKALEAK